MRSAEELAQFRSAIQAVLSAKEDLIENLSPAERIFIKQLKNFLKGDPKNRRS